MNATLRTILQKLLAARVVDVWSASDLSALLGGIDGEKSVGVVDKFLPELMAAASSGNLEFGRFGHLYHSSGSSF